MHRTSLLYSKVMSFRNALVEYSNALHQGKRQTAAQLRTSLNMQWGNLEQDLNQLGITRFYEQYGRRMPLFESALQSPDGRVSDVPFVELQMAVSELETVLGKLQRMIDEGPPVRHSYWITAFVFTFIVGWLVRHYQDRIILLQRLPAATTWPSGKVLLVAMATGISGISGSLFAGIVQANGWYSSIRRHPIQFSIYLSLTLGMLILAGISASQ